ncbi:MAG TPA: peptidylprolyl isomerase [Anaerolineae bacterium]
MAKQSKQEEARDLTKKQERRNRRDAEQNRRVLIGLGAAAGLILVVIAAGLIQLLVITPRSPIATVNGTNISLTDYGKMVKYAWFQQLQQTGQPDQNPAQTGQQVLDQLVDQQIVRDQAKVLGISVSQDEVTQAIEHGFGYYSTPPTPTPTPEQSPTPTPTNTPQPTPGAGTPAPTVAPTLTPAPTSTPISLESYQTAFKNYMTTIQKQTGMTDADFRSLVEMQLLTQKVETAVTKDVPTKSEQVHARHILISIITPPPTPTPVPTGQPSPTATAQPTPGGPTPSPTPAPRSDAEALARAKEVKAKLDAGGDFAKLAEQYSDDPGSAKSGGDLGWFGKGQMVPEFETAALALAVNQISDPVKTTYGYHIIQVLEKDAQHPIDQYTLQQNQYTAYQTWLDKQRTAAKITKNWSADKMPPTPVPGQ